MRFIVEKKNKKYYLYDPAYFGADDQIGVSCQDRAIIEKTEHGNYYVKLYCYDPDTADFELGDRIKISLYKEYDSIDDVDAEFPGAKASFEKNADIYLDDEKCLFRGIELKTKKEND